MQWHRCSQPSASQFDQTQFLQIQEDWAPSLVTPSCSLLFFFFLAYTALDDIYCWCLHLVWNPPAWPGTSLPPSSCPPTDPQMFFFTIFPIDSIHEPHLLGLEHLCFRLLARILKYLFFTIIKSGKLTCSAWNISASVFLPPTGPCPSQTPCQPLDITV